MSPELKQALEELDQAIDILDTRIAESKAKHKKAVSDHKDAIEQLELFAEFDNQEEMSAEIVKVNKDLNEERDLRQSLAERLEIAINRIETVLEV